MSVGELVKRLRAATATIIANAGEGPADAAESVTILRDLADRIEKAFPNGKDTRIATNRKHTVASLEQGVRALRLAEDLAVSIRSCIPSDVELLIAAFIDNVRRVVAEGSTGPVILRVTSPDADLPWTLTEGSGRRLVFEGVDLDGNACGTPSVSLRSPASTTVNARVTSDTPARVVVTIPRVEGVGIHEIRMHLRTRKRLVSCESTTITASIAVLPEAPLRVWYSVSSTRAATQEIVWNAGELKQGNDSCDRDTTVLRRFSLPEGWTYVSHIWTEFINRESVREREEVSGNDVFVQYRVPARGGSLCNGPTKLIHGRMEIAGTRVSPVSGPSTSGLDPHALQFGETVVVPVRLAGGAGALPVAWKIDVRLVYPDGSTLDLPVQAGTGPLRVEKAGASYGWDPASGKLTITAPARVCDAQGGPPGRRN